MRHAPSARSKSYPAPFAAAFSLVEVLIGILILALGLLGLGAIIPVIVREQRAAADRTLGIEVAEAAENLLTSRKDLDPTSPLMTGFDVWFDDTKWSSPLGSQPARAWLWEPWRLNGPGTPEMDINASTGAASGNFTFFDTTSNTNIAVIRLADRLWPPLSRQGSDTIPLGLDPFRPQFVWDFIGRRLPTSPGESDQIQIAVFVRRIDQNIRIPQGNYPGSVPARSITLYDILTERLPSTSLLASELRLPVAAFDPFPQWNPPSLPVRGSGSQFLPTNNGTTPSGMNYSAPIFLPAIYRTSERDVISLPGLQAGSANQQATTQYALISQPGQKIIDNLGNIYTVIAEPTGSTSTTARQMAAIHIEPAVPAWVPDNQAADPTNLPSGVPNPSKIHQLVFVPQIPAAVKLFTITRPAP